MNTTNYSTLDIWAILERISDPEIPVLSVVDLGVVREVNELENGFEILITPTYSGCPAMSMIETEIKATLSELGIASTVKLILSPAWTTDWMSAKGKQKLKAYGIAPPEEENIDINALFGKSQNVECPQCNSKNTALISQFGSTACKALYKCNDCLEPFDYFKCLR
jgi:ring-1,2-phenylacetyl-CoA epoxidase subunit PaaD